ncbi:rhodanese-like domain-containing protein [Acaryochloris sp. IP29b_bin.137]|uniref:sulfurtransferase n=1 Tax=Acaryochloris sp. IP29b_bin.137 TaxID=2969217 RepID=UPI002629470B|nr:rhodanese-like domain-containing protein [Acaryochloris sp. IP29b_bin.137]
MKHKSHPTQVIKAVALGIVLCLGAIALTYTLTTRSPAELPQAAYVQRTQTPNLAQTWIVSASEAKTLIDQGATLLDARSNQWLGLNRLPGSVSVRWQDFSPQHKVSKGNLLDNNARLAQKLKKLKIAQNRPVVVFANPPRGWGEEGRIVWMLRTLGHQQVAMVDGGYTALVQVNPIPTTQPRIGNFAIHRNVAWQMQQATLKASLKNANLVIIDTRTPKEYAGATPYGEQRPGHIPGAVSLHFRDLLTPQGMLLPQAEILAKLQRMGITRDKEIVAYCTGGIRSGWLTVVLTDLGFQVKNYAGSMWEWSAGSPQEYPLTVKSELLSRSCLEETHANQGFSETIG